MGLLNFFKERMNQSELNTLEKRAEKIIALEQSMEALSDQELIAKTQEFKDRLAKGEELDDLLEEAFAVVREAAHRVIGLKAYKVQLMGGIVLHEGRVAEMKTGEGKTLVAIFPLYLHALREKGAHLVTVNDYLAKYQSQWMGEVFEFLGMSVGCIVNGQDPYERKEQYLKDITYGTNNEFGFDYLRDNMVLYQSERRQRGFEFAIVDEVDSILIDEARTPLIISGRGEKSSDLYLQADLFARTLKESDVEIDEEEKTIVLREDGGIEKAERYFNIENLSNPENMEIAHHIDQAIRAKFMMKRDIDYVVQDGQVVIVDEFTGRLMPGRRYSKGLHQAIEAKEKIEIKNESQTLATITLQNYFRMYQTLSGMTGTAKTEEDEFKEIYNMDVVVIPTNRPVIRHDHKDVIYGRREYKDRAIIEEIIKRHEKKQPVLVGTISVEYSEYLSSLLKKRKIKHNVLNAKEHQRESEIVAQAGSLGAITIATNMAGRGTDILLGGNVEFLIRSQLQKLGYDDEVIMKALSPFQFEEEDEEVQKAEAQIEKIRPAIEEQVKEEREKVLEAGGLHVLGTSRHESRRIDNQLRGRSGRQGDPGSSQFFISLDDDLLRIFMSERITEFMNKVGMEDGVPIESGMITKNIENAQKKVESIHYGARKSVLRYDEVNNQQRSFIYAERNRVLDGEDLREHVINMLSNYLEKTIAEFTNDHYNIKGLKRTLFEFFGYEKAVKNLEEGLSQEEYLEQLLSAYETIYSERENEVGSEKMREMERVILLTAVDKNWMEHIDDMDNLKKGINLRAIGQQDPIQAYQMEGFDMYEALLERIQEDTLKMLFRADLTQEKQRKKVVRSEQASKGEDLQQRTFEKKEKTVGRNDPCPCGSGKKYKHCHMREDQQ